MLHLELEPELLGLELPHTIVERIKTSAETLDGLSL